MKSYPESNTSVWCIYTAYDVPEALVLYHPGGMGTPLNLSVKPRVQDVVTNTAKLCNRLQREMKSQPRLGLCRPRTPVHLRVLCIASGNGPQNGIRAKTHRSEDFTAGHSDSGSVLSVTAFPLSDFMFAI